MKEVARTANVAWSPSALQEIYLACGTVAQQLDATFRYMYLRGGGLHQGNLYCWEPLKWSFSTVDIEGL